MQAHSNHSELHNLLVQKKLIITTAESCTGGLLASSFIDESGSSKIFECGVITYANSFKSKLLNIEESLINSVGVISKDVAVAMAKGALRLTNADVAISTTGIAEPEEGELGLIYVGLAFKNHFEGCRKFEFTGSRNEIRKQAVIKAREFVLERLVSWELV